MRNRLLVLAPEFIPHPSPSGHRARFVARYAATHGWDAEVLSVVPDDYATPPDPELMRLMPDVRITRVRAFSHRVARRLGFSDTGLRAYASLRRAIGEIVRARRPSLMYMYGPTFYAFPLGVYARERFGLPYALDFTDPWVQRLAEGAGYFSKANITHQLSMALEPRTVRKAAHVFAVSDATNDEIRERLPDVPSERFSAVPFGFEPRDFETLRQYPRHNRYWDTGDGNFHFVYAGAMLPRGYETLGALFDGALHLRAAHPRIFERLRFHFFGTTYDPRATEGLVTPVAAAKGLSAIVSEHPRRIPYIDALNVLTSANAVLALGSSETHYTASKIFPCLLSGRPVLALYHEASNVCDTMREAGTGELVTYNDTERAAQRVPGIADAIVRIVEQPRTYASPRLDAVRQYSAEVLTGRMFTMMDTLVAHTAGSREIVPA